VRQPLWFISWMAIGRRADIVFVFGEIIDIGGVVIVVGGVVVVVVVIVVERKVVGVAIVVGNIGVSDFGILVFGFFCFCHLGGVAIVAIGVIGVIDSIGSIGRALRRRWTSSFLKTKFLARDAPAAGNRDAAEGTGISSLDPHLEAVGVKDVDASQIPDLVPVLELAETNGTVGHVEGIGRERQ